MNSVKWTASKIRALKGRRFACLTAYDYLTARIIDESGIPLILVGDSLGMVVLGYETTLPVTMEAMLHHTAAVARGAPNALVVGDMPFLSCHLSVEQALANAGRFLQQAGAGAVKIEGGALRAGVVKALVENGIPVMGHIGLTPQNIRGLGGYKVTGRQPAEVRRLIADARALERAGAFALVLECMPPAAAKKITAALAIPTIGIGAGPCCDGQILVTHDLLGLTGQVAPRFVKRYADFAAQMKTAVGQFKKDVEHRQFPAPAHCYD